MTPDSLLTDDWNRTIERLGGPEALAAAARETKAFAWGGKVPSPVALLRLVLADCLGDWGLRSTTAWAAAAAWWTSPTWPCSIACGGAAIGWPCWSAMVLPPASRR